MQRLFTIFLTLLLAGALRNASAQSSPTQTQAGAVLPWNGMLPSRVYQPFTSIIGKAGTVMIPGSDHAQPNDPTFTLPLPFAVQMLGTTYAAGYGLKVGVAGFASFNPGAVNGIWPYLLMPDPNYTIVLMPYWSDLRTSGIPGEGIYYRYAIDPTSQDTSWTVEWNVETASAPFASGRFQMVLTRLAAWSGVNVPLVMIQYNYDRSSPLARTAPPGHYGAQVGIKSLGQAVGPQTTYAPGDDDDQLLVMTYPPAFLSPYVSAITRLPTRVVGTQSFTPDWYATATTPPSSDFHYTFPDSSYRVKPIDADASCVRKGDAGDDNFSQVFTPGTPSIGSLLIHNHGTTPLTDVPVHISFRHDGRTVDSINRTVKLIAPQDSIEVQYPVPTNGSGEYRVRVEVDAAGDQYHANDTAVWSIWVSPAIDVMPVAITSPILTTGARARLYPAGGVVEIDARIINAGTRAPKQFFATFWVRDIIGNVLASRTTSTIPTSFPPGSMMNVRIGEFYPTSPGRYYVDVVVSADSDQVTSNDTLRSVPSRDRITRGTMVDDRHISQIPFEVVYATDAAAGDPAYYPHLPARGDTVRDSTQVMAMFINNGADSIAKAMVHAIIVDSANKVVYNHTAEVTSLVAGRRVTMRYFADFHPAKSGTYCVSAWIDPQPGDALPTNDTAHWCFVVAMKDTSTDTSTSAVPGEAASKLAAARLAVAPNPTSGRASIYLALPSAVRGRLVITDLLGRDVRSIERQFDAGEQTMPLEIDALPNGTYMVRIESAGAPIVAAHFVIAR